jgi:hypothetical protein
MTKERIIKHVIPKEADVCVDRDLDGQCIITIEGSTEDLDRIITVEQSKDGKYGLCSDKQGNEDGSETE